MYDLLRSPLVEEHVVVRVYHRVAAGLISGGQPEPESGPLELFSLKSGFHLGTETGTSDFHCSAQSLPNLIRDNRR